MMDLYKYFSSFKRMPVVPIVGYPALMPLKLTTYDCLLDPERHIKVIKYIEKELGVDALLPLLDLTVEAEVLGVKVAYPECDAPKIEMTLNMNKVGKRQTKGRIPIMVETAKKMKRVAKALPVGFYITGPFTVAGQVIGITDLLKCAVKNPELLPPLLETVTRTCLEFAKELEDAGIDFVVIAEPSSSLISLNQFREFSKPYLKRISKALSIDIVLHICGRSKHLLKDMSETGASAISIDQNIPMKDAVSAVPDHISVFGNYPPANLMFEDPPTIESNVLKMLTPVKDRRNVVSSTGCDIPPRAPLKNVKTFIRVSKSIER